MLIVLLHTPTLHVPAPASLLNPKPKQVRSLVRSTMDGADKKLEAMAGRVRKHLGHGPLFAMVWGTLKNSLLAR